MKKSSERAKADLAGENRLIRQKKRFPIHPFLFAAYYLVNPLALNLDQFETGIFRAFLIVIVLTVIIFLVGHRLFHDIDYTGYLATILVFMIFFYGHFYNLMNPLLSFSEGSNPHTVALLIWVFLLGTVGSKRTWRIIGTEWITTFLNSVSIFVLILPLYQITARATQAGSDPFRTWENSASLPVSVTRPEISYQPDIYYIVVDGYGRADILQEYYQYDNSEFLAYLEKQGFYVAGKSRTNYVQTALSLSSSQNIRYLDDLKEIGVDSFSREPLTELIQNSEIRRFLEIKAYRFVAFSTGYSVTEIKDADFYFSRYHDGLNITDFEGLLLNDSIIGAFLVQLNLDIYSPNYQSQRELIQYTFDKLGVVSSIRGPKFVFAHIISPHPPFVFNEYGDAVNPRWSYTKSDGNYFPGEMNEYIAGYINQIEFINKMLIEAIDSIISKSENPPIIIIQGDHGPGLLFNFDSVEESCLKERASILNAFLLPQAGSSSLYETITPVNSFRVILDTYFGTQLDLIEDESFYSTWLRPYDLINITESSQFSCNFP